MRCKFRKPKIIFDNSLRVFRNPAMIKAAIAMALRLYSKPIEVQHVVLINTSLCYTWYIGKKGRFTSLSAEQMRILHCFEAL